MRTQEVGDTVTTPVPFEQSTTPQTSWWRRVDRASLALAVVTLTALIFRLYGLNWDQNTHQHPDERAITMVVQCLGWQSVPPGCPPNPAPANPHFFAYGSFPMYLLALVVNGLAALFKNVHGLPTDGGAFNDYNHITLVGRALSALFDTGTVLVTGLLARRLFGRWWGVFAAAFVAFATLEVQLSHFYAVDTVLTFFVTLALFAAVGLSLHRPSPRAAAAIMLRSVPPLREALTWALLVGVATGLALTSKISAAPLALPIALALVLRWRRLGWSGWPDIVIVTFTALTTTAIVFVATMPYALLDPTQFWHDINEQSALASGTIVYPYTIQFANRAPYLDQLKNFFIWDLGATLSLAALAGVLYAVARIWRHWDDVLIIPMAWVVVYFAITGSFYTKFPRYQLPIFPMLAILATGPLAALAAARVTGDSARQAGGWRGWLARAAAALTTRFGAHWPRSLATSLAAITIAGGLILSLAYLSIYTTPMTRIQASQWIYTHIPAGSTITHEVWDDALPLPLPNESVYQYHYEDLNLYDPDTVAKTQTLANQLTNANFIILASARLSKSITGVPYLYPMTSRYYQLLFNGQLGFHLAHAPWQNYPHLGPFAVPDSSADESFSVYDHPTVWIFARDAGPPMTTDQIQALLLAGVNLPAQSGALASQKPLLLTPQAIAADNQTAPLWQRFSPTSWQTQFALPLWWLAVEILGLCVFPLLFIALPGLQDRGWGLAKALGVLGLSFTVWLPASLGLIPYEGATVWLALLVLALIGGFTAWRQRERLREFFRAHWGIIVLTEALTLAAFLFFVGIRSLDPDLWHIWRGGEKPMELAFLNGILRSRSLPPLDPWFAGSYINYYYFGQFLIATLIELTGIVPTTAFNLAIPMLFALTIAGAVSVVGGLTRRWWVGVLAGWAVAVAGNLDGLRQWWTQFQAMQAHIPVPVYDYWASSRVIPYTINEFPFWSFLYADLHAHVIDLPIILIGLGIAASLLVSGGGPMRPGRYLTYFLAALVLGAMACINTWDMPTYGGVIILALVIAEWRTLPRRANASSLAADPRPGFSTWPSIALLWLRGIFGNAMAMGQAQTASAFANAQFLAWWQTQSRPIIAWSDVRRVVLAICGIIGGAIALYLPFYTHFQSLYGKLGPVTTPTDPILFYVIFGLWLFVIVTFFAIEILDRWTAYAERHPVSWLGRISGDPAQRAVTLCLVLTIALTYLTLHSVKSLLIILILLGVILLLSRVQGPIRIFTYLVILVGLGVALVVEYVYLRDFLDNGAWERMNTVFKFYYQVWMLLGLGTALALGMILPRIGHAFLHLLALARGQDFAATDADYGAAEVGLPASYVGYAAAAPRSPEANSSVLAFAAPGSTSDSDQVADAKSAPPRWDAPEILEAVSWPRPATRARGKSDLLVEWGLRIAWLVVLVVLVFGSSVFLFEGTAVRVNDPLLWAQVQPPTYPLHTTPSLDGFAYMHSWFPGDAAAITWMNEHIGGDPVIVEASSDPYQWFGRVSIYTGLPAVLGWANHESQQRYGSEVFARLPDVTALYSSGDPAQVMAVVQKYNVHYIYVGQLECVYYVLHDPNPTSPTAQNIQTCASAHDQLGSLAVFQTMVQQGQLHIAYQNDLVTLYAVGG